MLRHIFVSLGLLLSAASAVFASPASITVQPTNQSAVVGSSVSYVVDFSGTPPVQCQWYKSGVAVTSATNAYLNLTNLSVTSAGSYYARVSNSEGTNTSVRARLFVEMTNAVSTPIALTGWNRDVILENAGTSFAQSFDEATNSVVYGVWFEEGVGGNPNGLPQSRQFTSTINHPDVIFELQPYAASNVLWMTTFTPSQRTNTLTLESPKAYVSLSIAAASGYANTSPSSVPDFSGYLILNFVDGSKSGIINLVSLDWFGGSSYLAITGLGRMDTTNSGAQYYEINNANSALFQTDINLLALGYAEKILFSITFVGAKSILYPTRTTTSIFAVSGVATELGINPPIFMQSNVTNQNVRKASDLTLSVDDGGATPISYRWQQQQFNSFQITTTISGATNASILRTNLINPTAFFVEARNAAGVASASAEINLYFGNLTANGISYNWGWNFFRQTSVRAQQSTNLVDWANVGTFNNSSGFTLSDNKQSVQKFFRIVPQ